MSDATDPTKPVASLPPSFAHPRRPSFRPPIRRPRAAPSSSAPLAAAVVLIGGYIPIYACQFQQRKAESGVSGRRL